MYKLSINLFKLYSVYYFCILILYMPICHKKKLERLVLYKQKINNIQNVRDDLNTTLEEASKLCGCNLRQYYTYNQFVKDNGNMNEESTILTSPNLTTTRRRNNFKIELTSDGNNKNTTENKDTSDNTTKYNKNTQIKKIRNIIKEFK